MDVYGVFSIPIIFLLVISLLFIVVGGIFTLTNLYRRSCFLRFFRMQLFRQKPSSDELVREWIQPFTYGMTYGEAFVLCIYVLLVVVWFLFPMDGGDNWYIPGPFNTWRGMRRAFARCASLQATLILIPANRLSICRLVFGIGTELSIKYHKFLAVVMWCFALTHGFTVLLSAMWEHNHFLVVKFSKYGASSGFGLLGLVTLTLLISLSYQKIREKSYATFLSIHWLLTFILFVFLSAHHIDPFFRYIPGLVLTVFDVMYQFFGGFLIPTKVAAVKVIEKFGVVRLDIKRPLWIGAHAGQYLYMVTKSFGPFPHPFSVSSSPLDPFIRVYVKGRGSATKRFLKAAKEGQLEQSMVRICGPFGTPFHTSDVKAYQSVLLFSDGNSGSGIQFAVLRDHLLRRAQGIAAGKEVQLPRIRFIWIVRSASDLDCFKEELDQVYSQGEDPLVAIHLVRNMSSRRNPYSRRPVRASATPVRRFAVPDVEEVPVERPASISVVNAEDEEGRPLLVGEERDISFYQEKLIDGFPDFEAIMRDYSQEGNSVGVSIMGSPHLVHHVKAEAVKVKKRWFTFFEPVYQM